MVLTSNGLNVYPEDIESVINSISSVKDSVVLGIQRKNGTVITAVVLLRKKAHSKNLINEINSKLESHQKIEDLIIWKKRDFPRTPSFKIKRRDVESDLFKKEPKESKLISTNKLFRILALHSKINLSKIQWSSLLGSDLKIDSLRRVELLSIIEEEYNVEIEESKVSEKTSVKMLNDLIKVGGLKSKKLSLSYLNRSSLVKPVRWVLQQILFLGLRVFYPVKLQGLENLEGVSGPVIFTMNHTSHLDSPTLLRALPFRFRNSLAFAAASDYFFSGDTLFRNIKISLFQILFNIYPFSRDGSIRESLKQTGRLIDKGFSIAIFPEGTRSATGKMGRFKTGIGLLASHMDVSIVPVKVNGLYHVLPKGDKFPRFGKAKVIFGKPLTFTSSDSYLSVVKRIEKVIRGL